MIKFLPFAIAAFFCFKVSAQDRPRILKGNVVDSATLEPVKDVTITLFKASDTTLVNFGFTTPNGNFELTTKIKDSLLMVVSQLGYREIWKKIPQHDGGWWWYNEKIKLAKLSIEMKEIQVVSSAIWMRGDTIEIAASRFKVMPGSDVSQLFAKIPGFKIDISGNLTVDGNKVSKIMVDGSDFFGNNPGLVSKNLKADMVQTVQVYEDKDENGVPLQDQTKTINLKLKKGKKNGMFGDVLLGYGNNERYESGLRLNSFKNDRKVSFISNSNNINGTGFDFGFDNWHGDNYMFRNGSGNTENYYSYSDQGSELSEEGNINRKTDMAVSFFNEYKKKRKFSFNVGLEHNGFKSVNNTISQNLLNDSMSQTNRNQNIENGKVLAYEVDLNYSRKIDSTGDVSLGLSIGQMKIATDASDHTLVYQNESILTEGLNQTENQLQRNALSAVYKYSKRAKKNKYIGWNFQIKGNTDLTDIDNFQFLNQNQDTLNIKRSKTQNMTEFNAKAGFKYPLYKDKLHYNLSADIYTIAYINNQLSKGALNPLQKNFLQEYSTYIDSLSQGFDNSVWQSSLVNSVSFRSKTYNASTGITYLNFSINNAIENGASFGKKYTRYLPYLSFGTWAKKVGYFFIRASQSVDFPKSNDLMPVQNLSNPFFRLLGNKELKPQDVFSGHLYWRKRKLGFLDQFSLSSTFNQTSNYILNSRTINEGIVYQSPLNNGIFQSFNAYSNFEKTFKDKFRISMNYQMYWSNTPQKINDKMGYNEQFQNTISPELSLTISDKFDMDLGYTVSFLKGKNSLNSSLNFNQITNLYKINLRGLFMKKIELSVSGNFNDQRQIPGLGKVVSVVNCYVQVPLDRGMKYNLKLSCYDLFKQNVSITRYLSTGGYVVSESNQLQRYFMLTLVRKLNRSGGDEDIAVPVY